MTKKTKAAPEPADPDVIREADQAAALAEAAEVAGDLYATFPPDGYDHDLAGSGTQ